MTQDLEAPAQTNVDEQTAARVAELFRALGDGSRVRILLALVAGEKYVGALAAETSVSESAVSHHLRSLRQLRLVKVRREGRLAFYSLDDDHVATLLLDGLDHVLHG
jgi:DNA-binding transcriptional ArsR family regulator